MKRTNFINKKISEQSGITLIALVLTIIILLILAGVAIATLTGDNGLLQKATTAKEANEEAKELELIKLAVSAAQVAGEGTITKDNLESELKINFNDNTITIGEIEDGWSYNSYKIDKSGEVDKLLPKEYQQVEYIESTGMQYIDTGYIMKSINYTANIEIKLTNISVSPQRIIGAYDGNNRSLLTTFTNQNGIYSQFGTGYGLSNYVNSISNIMDTNKHTIVVEQDYKIGKLTVDGIIYSGEIPSTAGFTNSSVHLFHSNGNTEFLYAKIYYCKIYDNSILIRNYIPCYSMITVTDVDGIERPKHTIGMYDTVEGKFYVNKGTGTFGYETLDGTYVAPSPTNN